MIFLLTFLDCPNISKVQSPLNQPSLLANGYLCSHGTLKIILYVFIFLLSPYDIKLVYPKLLKVAIILFFRLDTWILVSYNRKKILYKHSNIHMHTGKSHNLKKEKSEKHMHGMDWQKSVWN